MMKGLCDKPESRLLSFILRKGKGAVIQKNPIHSLTLLALSCSSEAQVELAGVDGAVDTLLALMK